MKRESTAIIGSLFILILLIVLASVTAHGEEHGVLKDMKSVKAVFDVRAGNPKSVALQLDLILQTSMDKTIREVTQEPEFTVVFLGPSVKLISTQVEGFSPEEKETLSKIANTVSELSKAGIGLEICLVATSIFGVDPGTVLPEIKQVNNGWISLIGYQAKGYSLIPVY
jgi:intracellular sulfur oxidation DsrE/DsrF family protein